MKKISGSFIKSLPVKIFLILFPLFYLQSCENNPNDLGFILLPNVDTTGVKYLDSQADTMAITANNYKQFINTSTSGNMLVGYYQSYQSRSLLKFIDISPAYDSVTVLSAILTLRNSGYYFKNQTGNVSFDLYNVNTNFNYSTVTFDSVNSSSFGTVSQGNYSGIPGDTGKINIEINNQTAKDWLEYAADSNYVNKNFGIGLIPNISSNTIRGFYSNSNNVDAIPYATIIFTKNNVEDTITLITSEYVSLSDAPSTIIPADNFLLQNGIAYRNILNFDLTKLPHNVIINNATLLFTLDNANSFLSTTTDKRIVIGAVTDSLTKTDSLFFDATLLDSITYTANLTAIVQRWNIGAVPNFGVTMKNSSENQNLDNFGIYSPSYPDLTRQPRLKINYTVIN